MIFYKNNFHHMLTKVKYDSDRINYSNTCTTTRSVSCSILGIGVLYIVFVKKIGFFFFAPIKYHHFISP